MTRQAVNVDQTRSGHNPLHCATRRIVQTSAIALAAVAAIIAPAAKAAESYSGEAHSRDGALLYREEHLLYRDNDADARLVMYVCPDGKPFARKQISYRAGAQAPDFAFEDARDGYAEGVKAKDGVRLAFVREKRTAVERTAPLATGADAVVDAGFDNFVRAHWDALKPGVSLPLSFIVPSKLSAIDFKVTAVGDDRSGSRDTRRFRLALARWYAGMLPHIDVIYDVQSRELLGYEGIANIRGADGRNLDVRISFPPQLRAGKISDDTVAAAAATALDGTCKL
jgi:hypothetical protein